MSKLSPDYTKNIIVAVIIDKNLSWYVTEREIWYLDYERLLDSYRKRGYDVGSSPTEDARKNMLILDSDTASDFLKNIKEYRTTADDLKKQLVGRIDESGDTWRFDFRPSLYVDFDKKILYSLYSEPASFEDYTPKTWHSGYQDFTNMISFEESYWLDGDSRNLIL